MSFFKRFSSALNRPVVQVGALGMLATTLTSKVYQKEIRQEEYLAEQKKLGFKRVKVGEEVVEHFAVRGIPSKSIHPVYELHNEETGAKKPYEPMKANDEQKSKPANDQVKPNDEEGNEATNWFQGRP